MIRPASYYEETLKKIQSSSIKPYEKENKSLNFAIPAAINLETRDENSKYISI